MKTVFFSVWFLFFYTESAWSGELPDFSGQFSFYGNYAVESENEVLAGGRFIPELSQKFTVFEALFFDYEVSADITAAASFHSFDGSDSQGDIDPYRLWGRFSGDQYEIRIGLQKINFGSASILRPLMWFDRIDPRDPLQLTRGVYGVLGKYYFLNNANVWLWALYGNDEKRGWDAIPGSRDDSEQGGRIQIPVMEGELSFSFHKRTANAETIMGSDFKDIPEVRLGLDGKWDVEVGLWFEITWTHRSENLGLFTNTTLYNIGMDYTFGIGNGLNIVGEHLVTTYGYSGFTSSMTRNISASTLSYPLGITDNVSALFTYDWERKAASFFLNYERRFDSFTGYFMVYYNPDYPADTGGQLTVNALSEQGIRVMVVYDF